MLPVLCKPKGLHNTALCKPNYVNQIMLTELCKQYYVNYIMEAALCKLNYQLRYVNQVM